MKRQPLSDAIADQQKLIRGLKAGKPVDEEQLTFARRNLDWMRKFRRPPSDKHLAMVTAVRNSIEFTLKHFTKPGMNPDVWTVAAEGAIEVFKRQNRKAVNTRHDAPGGSRDKAARLKFIWQNSTKNEYATKEKCAEDAERTVGLKFEAAKKALKNVSRKKVSTRR